jgi:hypothetical protein
MTRDFGDGPEDHGDRSRRRGRSQCNVLTSAVTAVANNICELTPSFQANFRLAWKQLSFKATLLKTRTLPVLPLGNAAASDAARLTPDISVGD